MSHTTVTFVSGFYDIGRKTQNVSIAFESYFNWIPILLSQPINMVFFTSSEIYQRLQGRYQERPNLTFKVTPTYPWSERLEQVTKAWIGYQTYHAEKDIPSFACVTMAKFEWLQQVMEENPYRTTHFAWIDAGLTKVARSPDLIPKISPPDEIRFLMINYISAEAIRHREFIQRCQYGVAAGLFTGSIESMQWFCRQVLQEAHQALGTDVFGLEQEFMAIVYRKFPERFDPYFGDFEDLINGYHAMYNPKTRYLVHRFIVNAHHHGDLLDTQRAIAYDQTFIDRSDKEKSIEELTNGCLIFTDQQTGLRLQVPSDSPMTKYVIGSGLGEVGLIRWCQQFLGNDLIFVDAGSQFNAYGLYLAKFCKEAHLFSLHRDEHGCVRASVSLSNIDNVIVHDDLIGKGSFDLNLNSDVQVGLVRLNAAGQEHKILVGSLETLTNWNYPPILFNTAAIFQQHQEALLSFLRGLGYNVFKVTGSSNMYLASDHPVFVKTKKRFLSKHNDKEVVDSETQNQEERVICLRDHSQDQVTWGQLYEQAKRSRLRGANQLAYVHAKEAFRYVQDDTQRHLLLEELSIAAYYTAQREDGEKACEELTLSSAGWSLRNITLSNYGYYMKPLSVKNVHEIKVPDDLCPPKYRSSTPSIWQGADGSHRCNIRLVNYVLDAQGYCRSQDMDGVIRTENVIVDLNKDFSVKGSGIRLANVSETKIYPAQVEGLEDVRIFREASTDCYGLLMCTCLDVNPKRIPQICLGMFDIGGMVHHLLPLKVTEDIQCEKNWLPWIDTSASRPGREKIRFIYSWEPFRVFELDLFYDVEEADMTEARRQVSASIKEIFSCKIMKDRNLDTFRGSSPPIRYKGGWLCTIHQVHYNNPRQYFHRFVWFSNGFTYVRYSKPFYFAHRGVEFNVSITHSDEGLVIGYSIKDNNAYLAVVDYEVVDRYVFGSLDLLPKTH